MLVFHSVIFSELLSYLELDQLTFIYNLVPLLSIVVILLIDTQYCVCSLVKMGVFYRSKTGGKIQILCTVSCIVHAFSVFKLWNFQVTY